MNSAEPSSPRRAGPPFQAYQYVTVRPSARRLVTQLMPLSLTRISGHPLIKGAGGILLLPPSGHNLDFPALWMDGVSRNLQASSLGGLQCPSDIALSDRAGHVSCPSCARPLQQPRPPAEAGQLPAVQGDRRAPQASPALPASRIARGSRWHVSSPRCSDPRRGAATARPLQTA